MTKHIDLLRHTEADGDVLTSAGIDAAVAIGRATERAYDVVVTSGAQRATQTAACVLAGGAIWSLAGVDTDPALRSPDEDRWRAIYAETRDPSVDGFLAHDRPFVEREAARLADAIRRVAGRVPDGGRALVVGHGPLLETAVWALTGRTIAPLDKGGRVVVRCDGADFAVEQPG